MRLLLLTGITGSIIGLFGFAVNELNHWLLPGTSGKWWMMLVTFAGIIILKAGTDLAGVIDDLQLRIGRLSIINTFKELAYSWSGYLAGYPIGPEAIGIHIGQLTGKIVARFTGLTVDMYRTICAAGVAAGISAVLNAPLGSAVLVMEMTTEIPFLPVFLSSLIAWAIVNLFSDSFSIISSLSLALPNFWDFILIVIISVFIGLISFPLRKLFNYGYMASRFLARKSYIIPLLIGGLIASAMLFLFPDITGNSVTFLENSLWKDNIALGVLLMLLAKFIVILIIFSTWRTPGMILPIAILGGLTGAILSDVANASSVSLAACGISALISGTLGIPFASALLTAELFGNMQLFLPSLIASIVSYHIAKGLSPSFLSTFALELDGYNLVNGRCMNTLSRIKAKEAMRISFPKIDASSSLLKILEEMSRSQHPVIPVSDKNGKFLGLISMEDIMPFMSMSKMERDKIDKVLFAGELVKKPDKFLSEDDTLNKATWLLNNPGFIPVIDNEGVFMGMIFSEDMRFAYRQNLYKDMIGIFNE